MEEKYKAQREYYYRNHEECKERNRKAALKYYSRNKEAASVRAKKWREENKEHIRTSQREGKRQRKEEAIAYLGGCCFLCKNTFHPSVYEFHHIDPATKDYNPSKMLQFTKEKLLAELDKCLLLCANCHRLTHHEGNY